MTKIEEVINGLYEKYRKAMAISKHLGYEPRLCIYMNDYFWRECLSEIHGGVCGVVYEFYETNKIHGYDVWRVCDRKHPPWVVVNLDE